MKSRNIATPVVLNVFDADGELSSGVASVEAVVMFSFDIFLICLINYNWVLKS